MGRKRRPAAGGEARGSRPSRDTADPAAGGASDSSVPPPPGDVDGTRERSGVGRFRIALPLLLVAIAIPAIFLARSAEQLRIAERATGGARARALDSAVGFHFPGNPFSRRAMTALVAAAEAADRTGDSAALPSWRRVRSAAASVRW